MKIFLILTISIFLTNCNMQNIENDNDSFSFVFIGDTRDNTGDNKDLFRGACEAISELDSIEFIVSPGDTDPPDSVLYTMQKYISNDIIWYPVVGNHEAETDYDMEWLRNYNKGGNSLPNIVNKGPLSCIETTYSFDYKNTHFVILNEYSNDTCDNCTKGDIPDFLYNWLQKDLQETKKENILVFGHEPVYPFPDMETQRFRHTDDCLNQYPENRDRFVNLLQEYNVVAYGVGHTHNYSIVKINKLWQIDAGHSTGYNDRGARSTFIKINVNKDQVNYETFRLNYNTRKYEVVHIGILN